MFLKRHVFLRQFSFKKKKNLKLILCVGQEGGSLEDPGPPLQVRWPSLSARCLGGSVVGVIFYILQ